MIEFSEYGRQVSFDESSKTLTVNGFATGVDGTYRSDNTMSVLRQVFNDDGWNSNVQVFSCPPVTFPCPGTCVFRTVLTVDSI